MSNEEHPWYADQIESLDNIYIFGYLAFGNNEYGSAFRKQCGIKQRQGSPHYVRAFNAYLRLLQSSSLEDLKDKEKMMGKINAPDILPLVQTAIYADPPTETLEKIRPLILNSDWDRIDPKRSMQKDPIDVHQALLDEPLWRQWYNEIPSEQTRNMVKMICQAYMRWRDRLPGIK